MSRAEPASGNLSPPAGDRQEDQGSPLNLMHRLRAAVAIDPAPIKGVCRVPLAQLRSSFVVLRNPGNAKRTVALTAEQFAYAFGNLPPATESDGVRRTFADRQGREAANHTRGRWARRGRGEPRGGRAERDAPRESLARTRTGKREARSAPRQTTAVKHAP